MMKSKLVKSHLVLPYVRRIKPRQCLMLLLLVAPYEIADLLVPPLGKAQGIPEMQWYLGSKII